MMPVIIGRCRPVPLRLNVDIIMVQAISLAYISLAYISLA
jgi:hypothetical protein